MAQHNPTMPFPNRPEVTGRFGGHSYKGESDMDSSEEEALIRTAVRNVAECYEHEHHNWDLWAEDVDFIYKSQWDAQSLKERKDQRRPALTINTLQNLVENVCGAARKRRFGIRAIQKAGLNGRIPSSRGRKYSYADVAGGIIRDVERRSMAKEHYLDCLQQQAESGCAYLELRKHRPVDDPRHVELRIGHVRDRWSVLIDHFAELPDGSDAMWACKSYGIRRREWDERFGEADRHLGVPPHLPEGSSEGFPLWWNNKRSDEVRFLEYWWKEPVPDRTLVRLASPPEGNVRSLVDLWLDDLQGEADGKRFNVLDDLVGKYGYTEVGRENWDSHHVMGAQMTHARVFQEPMRWEGDYLPLLRVPGRKVFHEGRTHYFGIARYSKDACRAANYWYTAATERVAMSPKDEYIVARQQVKDQKNNDFTATKGPLKSVKFYDHVEGVDPPKRQMPPQMPVAELQLADAMLKMVRDVTGIQDANLGKASNEVSGRAIDARAEAGANSTFVFIDNLRLAIEHMGRMVANMAPRITGPSKAQRIILDDDTTAEVLLNLPAEDQETGGMRLLAPIAHARYEVECTVGPETATQRQEAFQQLTELGKNAPEIIAPLIDLLLGSMDIPMAAELGRRAKMLVPRHMLSEEDQAALPQPQPTPAQQVEMQKAEAEVAKANAGVERARADVEIARASTEEQRARLEHRQLEIEEQRLQVEAEKVKLEQAKVALKRERAQAEAAEQAGADEAEIERRAKVRASETVDRSALP